MIVIILTVDNFVVRKLTFAEEALEGDVADAPALLVEVVRSVHVCSAVLSYLEVLTRRPHAERLILAHASVVEHLVQAPVDGVVVKVLR